MPEALAPVIDRLAEFTSPLAPVVSLYLDLRPDQTGRQTHGAFARRALSEVIETYPPGAEARAALERDAGRIDARLAAGVSGAHALAIFSCSGDPDLFEALPLDAPLNGHRLYVDRRPHLFPLARLMEQHGTLAVVLLDTNRARLFVVAAGAIERSEQVRSDKQPRSSGGGWSQARYQRHVDHLHRRHVKELAVVLERVVREDRVDRIVLGGDEVAVPLLREHLPPEVDRRIVDVLRLDIRTPDHDVIDAALAAVRSRDADSDRVLVQTLLDEYRAGGLATIGLTGVRHALERGQVNRLLVPAAPAATAAARSTLESERGMAAEGRGPLDEATIEELVAQARRTDASVTFIEDPALLEPARGVGALLRFRI